MSEVLAIDVAVIGGGPAGLAAAMALREAGVARVVVFERETSAGGIPRHCGHPPFGLREFNRVLTGPQYAKRLAEAAKAAGVEIRLRHSITRLGAGGMLDVASPEGAIAVTAKRVILATGVRETPRSARLIGGDRPQGIVNTGALQAYTYLEHLQPFRRPVIIGTELVAFSALLTCRKAGMRPVAMIEANDRVTARWPIAWAPRIFGVPLLLSTQLAEIRGRTQVESVLVKGPHGPREIACDGVILSGCFQPASELVRGSHLALDPGSGGPVVDQIGRCSDAAYFAAGNLLRAVETAGWSWREGRRVGTDVARDIVSPAETPARQVTIEHAPPIKLVVPQRLTFPAKGEGITDYIQLRVSAAVSGDLVVHAGGQRVWRQRISALPERRILIPLSALPVPADAATLRISIDQAD
ncbi:NAD(P)/FAD-dependent oxidoreductase [Dongia sp.]|uniref:NAD(P)/FAD-dependent oxidoreductase n=1 Tax=Dongia sp. TaxID=1977262 RepID=UPI0035B1E71F